MIEFLARRERIVWNQGLPNKPRSMLNIDEMAEEVGVRANMLRPTWNAFREAYNRSVANQKFMNVMNVPDIDLSLIHI